MNLFLLWRAAARGLAFVIFLLHLLVVVVAGLFDLAGLVLHLFLDLWLFCFYFNIKKKTKKQNKRKVLRIFF
jgi:hypothetical protein